MGGTMNAMMLGRPKHLRKALGGPALAGLTALFLSSVSLFGCGADSASAVEGRFENNVFLRTRRIEARIADSAAAPSISWQATGRRLVVAAFFSRPIDVRQNQIRNTNDLVWMWHSGMDTGREGNIAWADGAPASFGQPLIGRAPTPLSPGTYSWAVWSLDEGGKPAEATIVYSHTVP
jgi:hypothetical protein